MSAKLATLGPGDFGPPREPDYVGIAQRSGRLFRALVASVEFRTEALGQESTDALAAADNPESLWLELNDLVRLYADACIAYELFSIPLFDRGPEDRERVLRLLCNRFGVEAMS